MSCFVYVNNSRLTDMRCNGRCSRNSKQKTREGCGCPKFSAGRVFPTNFDAAGKFLPDFLGARIAIPAKLSGKENGCWKWAVPSGMLLDLFLRDRHSLLEFSLIKPIFCATFVLRKCSSKHFKTKDICITHAGFLEIDSRECFDARGFDSVA